MIASRRAASNPNDADRFRPVARVAMIGRTVALLLALALVASVTTVTTPSVAAAADGPAITLPIHPSGVDDVYWGDTWGAARGGGRSHIGVDMMGPKGTPLVAAADGTVTWFRHDDDKGNNLEITDASGWTYHYVHINNDTPLADGSYSDDGANPLEFAFAPGIERGATVKAGQVVAYMGDSGNAENSGSHLHFEIISPSGRAVNPTPYVDAALDRVSAPAIPAALLGPYGSANELLDDVFLTLTGRLPSSTESHDFAAAVVAGDLAGAVKPYIDETSTAAQIDRLYLAYFLRRPDVEGYAYWIEQNGSGQSLEDIAEWFAEGDEYQARYGALGFESFLDQLYLDVLDREPDEVGKDYWLGELESGRVTKGIIVVYFTEGEELVRDTAQRSEVVALTALFDDTMPTDAEIDAWIADRGSMSLTEAAAAWFL